MENKKPIEETALQIEVCPKCNSTDYMRHGYKKSEKYGKARIVKCRACGRYYYLRQPYIKGKLFRAKIFNLIIHLSYFNIDNGKIRDILLKYFRVKITLPTIRSWIKEFGNPSYKEAYRQFMNEIEEAHEFK